MCPAGPPANCQPRDPSARACARAEPAGEACDMASRGLAQQIVAAGEVEFQKSLPSFKHMSACEMVGKELAQGIYCAGGLQMTNLEAAENFAKLGCDRNFLEPSCEAVTADFSNSRSWI
jgi:hypothetical protein